MRIISIKIRFLDEVPLSTDCLITSRDADSSYPQPGLLALAWRRLDYLVGLDVGAPWHVALRGALGELAVAVWTLYVV